MTPNADTIRWSHPMQADQLHVPVIEDAANENQWLVAVTSPRGEFKALKGLWEAGFIAYVPSETLWRKTATDKTRVCYPLFPGYVFIGLHVDRGGGYERLHELRSIDGIEGFIRVAGEVARVPHSALVRVNLDERSGKFDKARDKHAAKVAITTVKMDLSQFQAMPREVLLEAACDGKVAGLVEMMEAA